MQLMMFIGNDLIEAIPLNDKDLRIPGYLGKFKRSLKDKYRQLVQQSGQIPDFLVCDPKLAPELPKQN